VKVGSGRLKVGVFIGHTQPTEGGGYTFVVEALTALEQKVGKCNHDFVVCHRGCGDIASRFPRLPSVDLNQRQQEALTWQGRLSERYPKLLPPLEAFALGCPVVASAVLGSEEQLGDAALLFAPRDEHGLARHILTLRDADTRARLIGKGDKRTRDGSTWDDYTSNLITSLDDLASTRRAWP
jgi:hypothetical protein